MIKIIILEKETFGFQNVTLFINVMFSFHDFVENNCGLHGNTISDVYTRGA